MHPIICVDIRPTSHELTLFNGHYALSQKNHCTDTSNPFGKRHSSLKDSTRPNAIITCQLEKRWWTLQTKKRQNTLCWYIISIGEWPRDILPWWAEQRLLGNRQKPTITHHNHLFVCVKRSIDRLLRIRFFFSKGTNKYIEISWKRLRWRAQWV